MTDLARILIIDDDPTILQLLADILSPYYRVFTASNAVDAIPQLDWDPVDLMIIDLNLPTLSGEEAIRLIRARPVGKNLPVLVVSADSQLHRRLLGADVQQVLEKPFSMTRLLQLVEHLLEQSGSTRRNANTVAEQAF